ncbi:hypothetical protein ACTPEM_25855, partial [Clostridioides difficile]
PTADSREEWQATMKHIALEGRCFVIGCNQYVEKNMYPTDLNYKFYATKNEMKENIVVLLGGRVAEELVLKDVSTGASNDLERVT